MTGDRRHASSSSHPYTPVGEDPEDDRRDALQLGERGRGSPTFLRRALGAAAVSTVVFFGMLKNTRDAPASETGTVFLEDHLQLPERTSEGTTYGGKLVGPRASSRPPSTTIDAAAAAATIVTPPAASDDPLVLVATNEYGEYDRSSLSLYGLDMVIEPHKETTLTVQHPAAAHPSSRFRWLLTRASDDLSSGDEAAAAVADDSVEPELDEERGASVTVKLTAAAPARYSLRVQLLSHVAGRPDSVLAETTVIASYRYVRRELRDLTEADSTAFFEALQTFYTVSLEEGKARYGQTFGNAKIMSAYHHSTNFCFHAGMHFNNAHASFDLWAENSLQMINPAVSLPYWDYTKDTAELGANWPSSAVFDHDRFGSALGSADNQYRLSGKWFEGVTALYDPDGTFVDSFISPGHNQYGFIDAGMNYQPSVHVGRTASFCEMESEMELSGCDILVDCFDSNDNVHDWSTCMENEVHAAIHGMIGGGWNCAVNMEIFRSTHPEYSRGLLSYTLEYVVALTWPTNALMSDYNDCDTGCTVGEMEQTCGCTCTTDFNTWSDDAVYDFMERSMIMMESMIHGSDFIQFISSRDKYSFVQDGEVLTPAQNMVLLRELMVVACTPGTMGGMAVGPSPLDPIFWMVHPIFEKALHVLKLSPTYKDTYNFEWIGTDCGDGVSGGEIDEELPFTERDLGFGEGSDLLTNDKLQDLLQPTSSSLPYVYDNVKAWGDCTDWDFEV